MIVSINTYYIICGLIAACGIIPSVYNSYIRKKGGFLNATWLIVVLLAPLNWFTPAIFTVSDCGEYTKNILLVPTGEYSLGWHNYIVNESQYDLYYEHITYGKVSADEIDEDKIIEPLETVKVPVVHIDYLFEDAPSSISLKSDGAVRTRLSCDIPEYEDEESDYVGEE